MQKRIRLDTGLITIRCELGLILGVAASASQGEQIGNRPGGFRHAAIRPVQEYGLQGTKIFARVQPAFFVHVIERMHRFVDIAGGRVLAVKDGKILNLMAFAAVLSAETQHGLAKIHDAIVGGGAGSHQIDFRKRRVFFEQHGNRTSALRRLPAAAACIFGDICADDDGLAPRTVEREMP